MKLIKENVRRGFCEDEKNFIDIDLVNFVFEQKNGAHVTYG